MRLIHSADVHLGVRMYSRTNAAGLNQREVDIARTFRRVVSRWIELAPDLIVIAGDFFDRPHPSNPAVVHANNELRRLREALPRTAVVIVAGNHDQSKVASDGSIFPLLASLGVHAVERQARRLTFPEHELAVLCVPDSAEGEFEPDPAYRYNVLVMHGGLQDVLPHARLTAADLHADRWTYVALGDYHVHRAFAPNCRYSGALEYSSTNPWGELREESEAGLPGKVFVEFDLTTGAATLHPVTLARPVIDLAPIEATGLEAPAVDALIAERTANLPVDAEPLVRLVVWDLPRDVEHALDHKAIRRLRGAMQFHFVPQRPDVPRAPRLSNAELSELFTARMKGERLSISDLLARRLETQTLPADVSREHFVATGLQYLRDVEATAPIAVIEPTTPNAE